MVRLVFLVVALTALVGCADYAGETAQLRSSCNSGSDRTACIDYQTLTAACVNPLSFASVFECQGVGPATPFHPGGATPSAQVGGAYVRTAPISPTDSTIAPVPAVSYSNAPVTPLRCTRQEQAQDDGLLSLAKEKGYQYIPRCT
jgi:hypothetical protein